MDSWTWVFSSSSGDTTQYSLIPFPSHSPKRREGRRREEEKSVCSFWHFWHLNRDTSTWSSRNRPSLAPTHIAQTQSLIQEFADATWTTGCLEANCPSTITLKYHKTSQQNVPKLRWSPVNLLPWCILHVSPLSPGHCFFHSVARRVGPRSKPGHGRRCGSVQRCSARQRKRHGLKSINNGNWRTESPS